jgi:Bacteriophage baseplate protein W
MTMALKTISRMTSKPGLTSAPSFLGTGWGFPPTFSRPQLGVEMVGGIEDIRQSLRILFSTAQGERVMLPEYGCDLWRMVFRGLTTTLTTELKDMVEQAIVLWEPRIDLLSVSAVRDPEQDGLVNIDVAFAVRRTNTRSNFVYPFFLSEATLVRSDS